MKCPNCKNEIERRWNYCPGCGARFRRDFFSSVFDRMFSSMNKDIRQMDRLMEKNMEALDLSPFFRQIRPTDLRQANPRGSGFTIRIKRSNNSPPSVSVRTFGSVDRERVQKQVREHLGRLGLTRTKGPEKPLTRAKPPEPKALKPKSIHEPRTEVKTLGSRVLVKLEMPGVKTPRDIQIRELESSLEIRARAEDRAYFKILTKPGRFRLAKRGFSEGVLKLEFS